MTKRIWLRLGGQTPFGKTALSLCALSLLSLPTAFAAETAEQNPHLVQGIESFKAGRYKDAFGQFGMAVDTEFQNAVLHYYLANTLICMKQREAAIREFRIAYALAPTREAGKLSREALSYLGADNYDDGIVKPVEKPIAKKEEKPQPAVDPIFAKTMGMLRKQAEDAGQESRFMTPQEQEATRILDEHIQKRKCVAVDILMRTNPEELHLPPEVLDQLMRVRALNEERMRRTGHIIQKTSGIRETADSLQTLLNEKDSKSAPRLVPHGTNLYIRNYKSK